MNRVETPLPPGDLDAALRAFFAAEMPAPWPPFRPPAAVLPFPARRPAPARRPWRGSRLALAASVALLALGALALPARLDPSRVRDPMKIGAHPKADVKETKPPFEELLPDPRGPPAHPEKVKTKKLELQLGPDGRVGQKITLEEEPSNR